MPMAQFSWARLLHEARAMAPLRRSDVLAILVCAVAATIGGAVIGWQTTPGSAATVLLFEPFPPWLDYAAWGGAGPRRPENVALARRTNVRLAAKTAGLIALSDDVLQESLDRLEADGGLRVPMTSLAQLRRAVRCETAIDETNWWATIRLRAAARDPADAALIAGVWTTCFLEKHRGIQRAQYGSDEPSFGHRAAGFREWFGATGTGRETGVLKQVRAGLCQLDGLVGRWGDALAQKDDLAGLTDAYENEIKRVLVGLAEAEPDKGVRWRKIVAFMEPYLDQVWQCDDVGRTGDVVLPPAQLLVVDAEGHAPGTGQPVLLGLAAACWAFVLGTGIAAARRPTMAAEG